MKLDVSVDTSYKRQEQAVNILLKAKRKNKTSQKQERKQTILRPLSADISGDVSGRTMKKGEFIPDDLLRTINNKCYTLYTQGDTYEINGIRFKLENIPRVSPDHLDEVKGQDNVIDFGGDTYFKYVSPNGKSYVLYTMDGAIGTAGSESFFDDSFQPEREKYISFWNYIRHSGEPSYINMSFTNDEIKNYLNEAGIHYGLFTIKMGSKETTCYYSNSKYQAIIHSKERYDFDYKEMSTSKTLFADIDVGAEFIIAGKSYYLRENHTLDIPYGIDIYDIIYPRDKNSVN